MRNVRLDGTWVDSKIFDDLLTEPEQQADKKEEENAKEAERKKKKEEKMDTEKSKGCKKITDYFAKH